MSKAKNNRCSFFVCCSSQSEKHLAYKEYSAELDKNSMNNSVNYIKETKLKSDPLNLSNIVDEKLKSKHSKENIDISFGKQGSISNDEKIKPGMSKNLNDKSSSSKKSKKLVNHIMSKDSKEEIMFQTKFSKNEEVLVTQAKSIVGNTSMSEVINSRKGVKKNSDIIYNKYGIKQDNKLAYDINLISDKEKVYKKVKNKQNDNNSSSKNQLFPNSSIYEQFGLIKNLMGNNSDLAMPLLSQNKEGCIETCRFPISRSKLMKRQSSSKVSDYRDKGSDSISKNNPDIIIEDRYEQSIYNTPRRGKIENKSGSRIDSQIKSQSRGDLDNMRSDSENKKIRENKPKAARSDYSKDIIITFSGNHYENKLHKEKLSNFKAVGQIDGPISRQMSISKNNDMDVKEFSQRNIDSCVSLEKIEGNNQSLSDSLRRFNLLKNSKKNNSAGLRFLSIKEVAVNFFKFLRVDEKIFAQQTFRKTLIIAHGMEFFKRLCYLALQNEIWNGLNEKNKPLLYKYMSDDNSSLMNVIKNSIQLSYWDLFIDFNNLGEVMLEKQFDSNRARVNTEIDYIDKDVDRTLSHLINSVYTQKMIKEVLVALTNALPGGYSQGISSIAGALILKLLQMVNFGEGKDYSKIKVISYWVMKYLLVKMDLELLYENSLELYNLLCYQFDILIEYYLPDLKKVMIKQKFDIKQLACNWFQNIYSDVLPIQLLMNIWNAFMAKGYKVLLQVGLAILSQSRDEILKRAQNSDDGIVLFFCEKSYLNQVTPRKVAEEVKKYKIPYRILTEMETYYQENKKTKDLIKLSIFLDNKNTLNLKPVPKFDSNKLSVPNAGGNYHSTPNRTKSGINTSNKNLLTDPDPNIDREKYNFFDSTMLRTTYEPKNINEEKKTEDNEWGFFTKVKNWFTSDDVKEGENKENNNLNNMKTNYKTNQRKGSENPSLVSSKKKSKSSMIFVKQEDDLDYMPVEFEEIKESDLFLDEAAQKFRDDTEGVRGNNFKTTLQ